MELLLPLLALISLVVVVLVVILLCHGLDPLRLVRASFKMPRLHLTPLSAASHAAENEALLADDRKARIRFTGKVPLYTDTITELAACASPLEVDALLQRISLHRLLNSKTKAQHFAAFCRSELALSALSARVLATIVTALQPFAASESVAQCMLQCFCATSGAQTLALKNEIERQVSLFRLVYHFIRSASIRDALLAHVEAQALVLLRSDNFVAPIKLVCDIDDTMLSALFDSRYPELTVYPGVHQFVHEVQRLAVSAAEFAAAAASDPEENDANDSDASTGDAGVQSYDAVATTAKRQQQRTSQLTKSQRITFLTARPELLRKRSTNELRACGFANFTLLMGRLTNVLGSRRIATGKLKNFTRFKRIFAEHQFIFVGDNGQGDIDLGKALLASPQSYHVVAVLIHDVIRNHASVAAAVKDTAEATASQQQQQPPPPLARLTIQQSFRALECQQHNITLFRTYIGASAQLYTLRLLPLAAVERVVAKTAAAFDAIAFDSDFQKQNVAAEIMGDVALVSASLVPQDALALLAMLSDDLVRSSSHTDSSNEATGGRGMVPATADAVTVLDSVV